jgi:hypothetical protein
VWICPNQPFTANGNPNTISTYLFKMSVAAFNLSVNESIAKEANGLFGVVLAAIDGSGRLPLAGACLPSPSSNTSLLLHRKCFLQESGWAKILVV